MLQNFHNCAHLIRPDFVVDLLDAHFASSDVATLGAEILHPGQGQLAQVSVFNAGTVGRTISLIRLAQVEEGAKRKVLLASFPTIGHPSAALVSHKKLIALVFQEK